VGALRAMSDRRYDVFVSYAWSMATGDEKVGKLVVKLRELGLTVFYDKDCLGQGDVRVQLGVSIRNSTAFVPIISRKYVDKVEGKVMEEMGVKSDYCMQEFNLAAIHHGVVSTIPVVMEMALTDSRTWGDRLAQFHSGAIWVNFTDEALLETAASLIFQYLREIETSGKVKKPLLGPLAAIDTEKNLDSIKKKADEYEEGTRLWILEHLSNFVASNKQVYVILGSAGIGKSVLLAFICEIGNLFEPEEVLKVLASSEGDAKRRSSSVKSMIRIVKGRFSWGKLRTILDLPIVAAFAFKHDDAIASNAKMALSSICKQMLDSVPHYAEEVTGILSDFDVAQKDIDTIFEELIVQPLKAMEKKRKGPKKHAAIVIDALDECDGKQRGELIRVLLLWQERVPKWLKQISTSRRAEYVIPGAYELRQKPMEIDADGLANMQDMKVYLTKELNLYMAETPMERDHAAEVLCERSEGSFLYADLFKTILKEIDEREGGITLEKIKNTAFFPFGIDGMYQKFFRRFFDHVVDGDKRLFQALLGPMCVAREPIPVDELRDLVGMDNKDDFAMLLRNIQQLLVVSHDVVRFVHKSMADWLPNPGRNFDKELLVKRESAKDFLARYCLENCTRSSFAARNVVYHAALVEDFERVSKLLLDFDKLSGILITQKCAPRQFVRDCEECNKRSNEAELVLRALEKGLNGLDREARELPGQLLGRLPGEHSLARKLLGVDFGFQFFRAKFEGKMIQADAPLRKMLVGHKDIVFDVSMHKDIIVSASRDDKVNVWSKTSGEVLKSINAGSVNCIGMDREMFVTGMDDGSIQIWNLETGEKVRTMTGHNDKVRSVVIDGDSIISGSYDTTVRIWEIASGKETKIIRGHANPVQEVSADEEIIASASYDKTVKVWERITGELIWTLEGHESLVTCVAIHSDAIISGSEDATMKLWLKRTGELHHSLEATDAVMSVALDEHIIVCGSCDTTVKVWDRNTFEQIRILKGHSNWVTGLVMDEESIVSCSIDGTARIWSRANITKRLDDDAHDSPVNSMAVNEEFIATGSGALDIDGVKERFIRPKTTEDYSVRVWSLVSGELLHTFRGHKLPVKDVSLDGDVITSRAVEYELVPITDEDGKGTEYRMIGGTPMKLTEKVIAEETLHWSISKKKQLSDRPNTTCSFAPNLCNFTTSKFLLQPKDPSIVGLTMDGKIECIISPPNNPDTAIAVDSAQRVPIHIILA